MPARSIFLAAGMLISLSASVAPGQPTTAPDDGTVRQKIQLLGTRDDTIPYDQRSETWLVNRREAVVPELIAGLNDAKPAVAEGCLCLLDEAQPRPEILAALLPIAKDPKHPINAPATLALVRYPSDAVAAQLMAEAYVDEKRFPKPLQRAELAAGAGKPADAIAILSNVATKAEDETDAVQGVEQLLQIGTPAAPALAELAKGNRWRVAVAAYFALDKLDPQKHALTADQRQFLEKMGRSFKASMEFYQKRAEELAALNRAQVRPLVIQALHSTDFMAPREALNILTIWQDKEALPEIKMLIEQNQHMVEGDAMAAYLAIDGGKASEDLLLQKLKGAPDLHAEALARSVVEAPIPDDRRVELLRDMRNASGVSPYEVPHILGWFRGDMAKLLPPLMNRETDLRALGMYAEKAADDKQQRFGPEILRAVQILAASTQELSADDDGTVTAATEILNAAGKQKLASAANGIGVVAKKQPAVRLAALSAAVRIDGALDDNARALLDALKSPQVNIRRQAADGLQGLNAGNEAQRKEVESALLEHLGKPSEDYALRLLAKFGGARTRDVLTPVMDDASVPRALYAAWVLAQVSPRLPGDSEAAIRRLAINGLFNRFAAQQYGGIGFDIAPDLSFSQTTDVLNTPGEESHSPVVIPRGQLLPLNLSPAEQTFAIAAYRYACNQNDSVSTGICPYLTGMDASYLPLLKVIASEDPRLEALYVKNEKVAHFPDRRSAAVEIAQITGKPAEYVGLAGDALKSDQTPTQPYPDQDAIIAKFAVDRVLMVLPNDPPETDAQWTQINWRSNVFSHLNEEFGEGLKPAIIHEIEHRGLTDRFVKMRLVDTWLKQ